MGWMYQVLFHNVLSPIFEILCSSTSVEFCPELLSDFIPIRVWPHFSVVFLKKEMMYC